MFDFGAPELIIVLVLVLLLFGPGRIGKLAKEVGDGIRTFKEGLSDNEQKSQEKEL